jgi:hypothetical protein
VIQSLLAPSDEELFCVECKYNTTSQQWYRNRHLERLCSFCYNSGATIQTKTTRSAAAPVLASLAAIVSSESPIEAIVNPNARTGEPEELETPEPLPAETARFELLPFMAESELHSMIPEIQEPLATQPVGSGDSLWDHELSFLPILGSATEPQAGSMALQTPEPFPAQTEENEDPYWNPRLFPLPILESRQASQIQEPLATQSAGSGDSLWDQEPLPLVRESELRSVAPEIQVRRERTMPEFFTEKQKIGSREKRANSIALRVIQSADYHCAECGHNTTANRWFTFLDLRLCSCCHWVSDSEYRQKLRSWKASQTS